MDKKGKALKICGWCGKAFFSDDNGKIAYCSNKCKSKREKSLKKERFKDEF
ncbi:TPA: hypothetical protein RQB07_003690 [Clostridioides difficile]|nr:hypothetical protein [Clostridioides difficile]